MRATVIGSGPNGLSAAVVLARAGYDVRVYESGFSFGGGVRTEELTLPGFVHDVGSAVHPAALASPLFRALGLHSSIDWIRPEISYAHALANSEAAVAWHDVHRTAAELGADGRAWTRMLEPLSRQISALTEFTGNQLLRFPRHPITTARFGLRALEQGTALGARSFRTPQAAALLAGVIAHAGPPLPSITSAAAGLLLAAQAHAEGWVYPRGGAQKIADALTAELLAHGGTIDLGTPVSNLSSVDWGDAARGHLLILSGAPQLLLTLPSVPPRYAARLRRYRYGTAVAKVDFALDGPVPWRNPQLALAPTVHLGGTRAEIFAAENAVNKGIVSTKPFVIVVQPSVLDDSRAPEGKAVLWTYIHVPPNSPLDPTARIVSQIEDHAPGFRDRVLATHVMPASEREATNASQIGGDILGGAFTLTQAVRRPTLSVAPWRTPLPGVYLGSAATPPGPGVSGMPGWHAARTALKDAGLPHTLQDL